MEREAAELGVAIAAARVECVEPARRRHPRRARRRLAVSLGGARACRARSRRWSPAARRSRRRSVIAPRCATIAARDAAAGRTLIGPHLADLDVMHGPKAAPAARASTGEQKALLVGIVLAHARLVADMSGIAPIALLDEIAAHFDPRRREALFAALARIGGQAFLTGADPAAFATLGGVVTRWPAEGCGGGVNMLRFVVLVR